MHANITKYEEDVKFLINSILILQLFFKCKRIYVITKDSKPWIALYFIIYNNEILDLYMHEYIWNSIDIPLNPSKKDIMQVSNLKSKLLFKYSILAPFVTSKREDKV